jgi:hypothetical protein
MQGVLTTEVEASTFINFALMTQNLFISADVKKLGKWFTRNDSMIFPLLTEASFDNTIIAFRNGYFNLETLQFCDYVETNIKPTKHYFDIEVNTKIINQFDFVGTPTPLWDSLLETQIGSRSRCHCGNFATYTNKETKLCHIHQPNDVEPSYQPNMCDLFEILVGRSFFPLKKYDDWQVMLFILGDGHTGKSTLLDLIGGMFPGTSISAISSNTEDKFGLQSLYNKRLVLIPDLPSDFAKIINRSLFQSMVTGDIVNVPLKGLEAISGRRWTTPMIGAGNYLPNYEDTRGSVTRRFALFKFINLVANKNPRLKEDIMESELVHVMLRCIMLYRKTAFLNFRKEFWEHIAPKEMLENKTEVTEETNRLANFITNGGSYYQVIREIGSVTDLSALDKAFSNHCLFDLKLRNKHLGKDYYPIKSCGYLMEERNICKICGKVALVSNCNTPGDNHYSPDNRTKKVVILDMRIIHTQREY